MMHFSSLCPNSRSTLLDKENPHCFDKERKSIRDFFLNSNNTEVLR